MKKYLTVRQLLHLIVKNNPNQPQYNEYYTGNKSEKNIKSIKTHTKK